MIVNPGLALDSGCCWVLAVHRKHACRITKTGDSSDVAVVFARDVASVGGQLLIVETMRQ